MKKKFVLGVFLLVMSLLGSFQGLVKASVKDQEKAPSSIVDRMDLVKQNQIIKNTKEVLRVIKNQKTLKKVFKKVRKSGSLDQLRSFQIVFF